MSLSGALSNAVSGLNASSLATSVVSANIANSLNEDYGRRSVVLSTDGNQSSGGVKVAQIERHRSPILIHQKRSASSSLEQADVFTKAAKEIEQLWGSVDTHDSIAEKLTRFETSLLSASADPSSETRLRALAQSAEDFASGIRSAGVGVQDMRSQADAAIADAVEKINTSLQRVEKLNGQIVLGKHTGLDVLALLDLRDTELDHISEFVPLHTVERESGAVSIFSSRGRTLLDGKPVTFEFVPTKLVTPDMTLANGSLSSLLIDGVATDTSERSLLFGGNLTAHFDVRDTQTVQIQETLDAIARDVIERFDANGRDPTLGTTDAGAFTNGGLALTPTSVTGLAQRLAVHEILHPSSTELWRWRDGILASAPGDEGESNLLISLKDQVEHATMPSSLSLGARPQSLTDHVQRLSSEVASTRVFRENQYHSSETEFDFRREAAAAEGVDTDGELQNLILLEKSYAASAQVVRVIDDMLEELLRL